MEKRNAILIAIVIIVAIWLVFFAQFRTISTDKETYAVGETVKASVSDFKLIHCSGGPLFEFFQETSEGWKKIEFDYPTNFGRRICVDGVAERGSFGGEGIAMCFPLPLVTANYAWNSQIYEKKTEKETCEDRGRMLEEPVDSYQIIPAPVGKYKVKFGDVEKVFEIK